MSLLNLNSNLSEGASSSLFFLSLDNVTLQIGGKVILDHENLSVTYNRIVLLKGRVGKGKTAILKMFGGLHDYSGKITHKTADGEKLDHIFLHSTAEFNFITGYVDDELTLAGLDKSKFPEFRGRSVYDMSGGELKRLSILMALERGGESAVLIDEPLDMLDDGEAKNMAELIYDYSNRRPFIIATHDNHFDNVADVIISLK